MIDFANVSRVYSTGRGEVAAVRAATFRIVAGEWVTLTGPSGCGKSTLLNLIAGLERPSAGVAVVAGVDLGSRSEEELARWRAHSVGIVFQFFQLLPTLTALENVMLPLDFAGFRGDRRRRAESVLAAVGLTDLGHHLPSELSGGEQQRVAVARALVNAPPLVVADEPTGNLDAASGAAILDLLLDYWRGGGSLILVTHDPGIAARAPRCLRMRDGEVFMEETLPSTHSNGMADHLGTRLSEAG